MLCLFGILIRMSEEVVEVYVGVEREVVAVVLTFPHSPGVHHVFCRPTVLRLVACCNWPMVDGCGSQLKYSTKGVTK